MEQTYAIELKNITKRFGKIVANDGINLKVKRGEILSLLGENGSGRTWGSKYINIRIYSTGSFRQTGPTANG